MRIYSCQNLLIMCPYSKCSFSSHKNIISNMNGSQKNYRNNKQIKPIKGLPCWFSSKESACNAGDLGSIPRSGRLSGGGHGTPLWYSCIENLKDSGSQKAAVCKVSQSWTRLKHPSISDSKPIKMETVTQTDQRFSIVLDMLKFTVDILFQWNDVRQLFFLTMNLFFIMPT